MISRSYYDSFRYYFRESGKSITSEDGE